MTERSRPMAAPSHARIRPALRRATAIVAAVSGGAALVAASQYPAPWGRELKVYDYDGDDSPDIVAQNSAALTIVIVGAVIAAANLAVRRAVIKPMSDSDPATLAWIAVALFVVGGAGFTLRWGAFWRVGAIMGPGPPHLGATLAFLVGTGVGLAVLAGLVRGALTGATVPRRVVTVLVVLTVVAGAFFVLLSLLRAPFAPYDLGCLFCINVDGEETPLIDSGTLAVAIQLSAAWAALVTLSVLAFARALPSQARREHT